LRRRGGCRKDWLGGKLRWFESLDQRWQIIWRWRLDVLDRRHKLWFGLKCRFDDLRDQRPQRFGSEVCMSPPGCGRRLLRGAMPDDWRWPLGKPQAVCFPDDAVF
jgi:hypothetical protein